MSTIQTVLVGRSLKPEDDTWRPDWIDFSGNIWFDFSPTFAIFIGVWMSNCILPSWRRRETFCSKVFSMLREMELSDTQSIESCHFPGRIYVTEIRQKTLLSPASNPKKKQTSGEVLEVNKLCLAVNIWPVRSAKIWLSSSSTHTQPQCGIASSTSIYPAFSYIHRPLIHTYGPFFRTTDNRRASH